MKLNQGIIGKTYRVLQVLTAVGTAHWLISLVAAIATIKRETQSWKFTMLVVSFQLIVAWTAAVLVYQIGTILLG